MKYLNCEKTYVRKSIITNVCFLFIFSRLTERECNLSGGVIHFTVMDHDLMWSNDFEGEAFLELSKLPGIRNDSVNENRPLEELKKIELSLTHPKGSKKSKINHSFIFH